jgi:hypothetical protein
MKKLSSILIPALVAAALGCAAAEASAQTVLKRQGEGTRRYAPISLHAANQVDASEAARSLAKAQRARKQGAEPLPGEQSFSYWQRQEKLRRAVEMAQRRSNETLRPRLAQR